MVKKFKKGDQVIVISGADKGKIGKITLVKDNKITVEGVNFSTIHKKPTSDSPGRIVKIERPIHISNVSHVENGKAVKVSFKIEEGKDKVFLRKNRISKKSGKKIS